MINTESKKIYNFAIIGGGAAGLFLANKLKDKNDIILIESGQENSYEKNNDNFNYQMKKNEFYKLHTDQIAGIGGNTNVWGGQLLPFTENDLNPNKGWPFGIKEIENHYNTVSKELFGQCINFYSKSYIKKITNLPIVELEDNNLDVHISARLREPNFRKIFFKKTKEYTDFVYENYVDKIDKKRGIFYIYCKDKKNNCQIIKSKRVIITCGAIQSVRLLTNSSKKCKLFYNENLGKGFIDHTTILLKKLHIRNRFSFLKLFNTRYLANGNKISVRISASKKYLLTSKQNISGMIMVDPPKNFLKRLINLITILLTKDLINFIYRPFGDVILCFIIEQISSDDKYLKINKRGKPYLSWHINKNEAKIAKDFGKLVINNLKKKKLIFEPGKLPESNIIFSKMHSTNHPMGGAVMHLDLKKSVVNKNLEVINCKNLYVCSTAVFPSGSHSNPTMTLLALANRLAQHLE